MRNGPSTTTTRTLALLVALAGLLVVPAVAGAAPNGAAFTTINSSPGGDPGGTGADEGLCHNGNGNVNCNQYAAKSYVWINGGPDNNALSQGTYFFAVLVPGTQRNPNDQPPDTFPKPRTDGNLSDDFDPYTNRTFTVDGSGNIATYGGTHSFDVDENDNNEKKIRLFPYSDTTNNGGVYILAICQLEPTNQSPTGYPVNPNDCKYDAFKIQEDETPPDCPRPVFSVNSDGLGVATQVMSDPGGIDTIEIDDIINLAVSPLKPGVNWFQGTTSQVTLTATEEIRAAGARIRIFVTDVAGNTSRCDPVLTRLRVRARMARAGREGPAPARTYRVSKREDTVTIRNGRPGLSRMSVTVNGKRFVVRNLRPGERRRISIRSALRKGDGNKVTLRGRGLAGGFARIMIAN